MVSKSVAFVALAGILLLAGSARADLTDSMKRGTPEIKSAGPLAFGPEGLMAHCLAKPLKAWTPYTICSPSALQRAPPRRVLLG